ncbi:multisubunit potassium/proton antiporter, PhaG subunit [Devosia lucknowensis]|uniref:Multisubunit potassium/proton antiporter, PhaG subunit n=1 Tax=Devosia lucknowensis TaxID=1096929 RepID=A0A1Y6ESL4_9HYPH|nr:monovalent cation/H(+) antiporter subunit G [Devosia lucknowensis]SMQ63950.1 multisubunit potassium/proton antiporter, PhaG subunit [Devosia lucknowensis]
MTFEDIPLWAAILVGFLVVFGSFLALVGAIGMARMPSFYQRIHAPTLGTSFGAIGVLAASAILSTIGEDRFIAHEFLIFVFVNVTTPVTLMLLARAALHRDRVEGSSEVPAVMEKPVDQ